MAVEMKPGVWKTRDEKTVTVRYDATKRDCPWIGSDNKTRYPNGQWMAHDEGPHDLVEYLGEVPEPQPDAAEELGKLLLTFVPDQLQETAAEELAALRDDRDRWRTRAVQAEGRLKTMGQELATARQQLQDRDAADQVPGNEQLRQQVTQLIAEREGLMQQLQMMEKQAIGLTNTLADKQQRLDHVEQQRSILLETSQDQLGQIRMAERVISIMADKVAQLAVEGA